MTTSSHPDVVVIGAGVAGLAAAVALAADGASVTLLERRPFPGGRAYSYPHPALNETIDSQHVILGCCTNFIDLLTQSNAAHTLRWYDTLTFLQPQTRVPHVRDSSIVSTMGLPSLIHPTHLPAPFHNTLSFLRAPMLTLRDKAAIATGLTHFLRTIPSDDTESFASWLRRTHQTERAIRHFWEPIILGALNDTFDRCSLKYAAKVFHESFLRSSQAGRLGIPTAPLSEFFAPVLTHARALGVEVRFNTSADAISPLSNNRWRITSGPATLEADALILATNLRETHALLASIATDSGCPIHAASSHGWDIPNPAHFTTAPITTIHLWYDREITPLDHAVLLDTRIQWLFNKSRIRSTQDHYIELVISASHAELALSREQILASALAELALFFPQARTATLLKSAVLKEARATFSVTPGLDAHRPPQTTACPNLFLAGDYTATDWPSTMESAVRSGRLAAAAATGSNHLSPELPPTGLMRLLTR